MFLSASVFLVPTPWNKKMNNALRKPQSCSFLDTKPRMGLTQLFPLTEWKSCSGTLEDRFWVLIEKDYS